MKLLLLLVISLGLSACATTPVELDRTTLKTQKIEQINLSKAEQAISIIQSDSSSAAVASAGLLGALIGAAIDSGVNSKRNKRLQPVLTALGAYNPNDSMRIEIEEHFKGSVFQESIKINNNATAKVVGELIPTLVPSFQLSPNFATIIIGLSTQVDQPGADKKVFHSYYVSQQEIEGTNTRKADVSLKQLTNKPQVLINSIELGIDHVVQQFFDDYNGSHTPKVAPIAEPELTTQPILNIETEESPI